MDNSRRRIKERAEEIAKMLPSMDNPEDITESILVISSLWASYSVTAARVSRKNILPLSDETYAATRRTITRRLKELGIESDATLIIRRVCEECTAVKEQGKADTRNHCYR